LPLSRVYGRGESCPADGARFYVPVNLLAADYSHVTGAIKAHRITLAWEEVVRLVASMSSRVVAPSLVLLRLGSYARQNRIHQALAEIGRIRKTVLPIESPTCH
jgi:TnpA family transposase